MIRRAIGKAILWTIGIASALSLAHSFTPDPVADPDAAWKASGMVEVLYDHRDECWTGEAPADVDIPTHVIVRTPSTPWRYAGQAATTRALNKVFDVTPNDPIIVLAFCR